MYPVEDTQGKALSVIPFSKVSIEDSDPTHPPFFAMEMSGTDHQKVNHTKCPTNLLLATFSPFIHGPSGLVNSYNVAVKPGSGVGFMLGSLSWSAESVVVDTEKRTLVDTPKLQEHSLWSELLTFTNSTLLQLFGSFVTPPGSSTFKFYCNATSLDSHSWETDWTSFNLFSDKYLGLSNQSTLPQIKLHEFENMLEDWAAMNLYIYHKMNILMNLSDTKPTPSVSVSVRTQVSQLQFRALPVFGGFSASLVMLAIAATIVFTIPGLRSQPDEIGVLQLLWLSDLEFDLGHPDARPQRKTYTEQGLLDLLV
ncbi:hypothetical protein DL96DRAFT_1714545 [Flagelloscypha sp. PMI_526]|nr:hypothetical protein DL96DRAFT_1714545 [Flagelloscypha sp. PMI_526]